MVDLSLPFPRQPIPGKDGQPIGYIERTPEGVFVSHVIAGDLPRFDEIDAAVTNLVTVHDAVATCDKAAKLYEDVMGRHERALLTGVHPVPESYLTSARAGLDRAEKALADLLAGKVAERKKFETEFVAEMGFSVEGRE